MEPDIQKPTAILNPTIVKRNIARMAEKASRSGVRFRPHFKTHQSAEVGEWFREAGVSAITVSSVTMARYFADHGWNDITIAFPVNWREIDAMNDLASRIDLHLLVESVETVDFLGENLTSSANLWIKTDTGYHRTGIEWHDSESQKSLVNAIAAHKNLNLCGLLTHSGHSYAARGQAAIQAVYNETVECLNQARRQIQDFGIDSLEISIGDTPTCSAVDDLGAVDEIRPGCFVFYDLMQQQIGACGLEDIAMAVACPVVAKHPARNRAVIYGGAIHFSKDSLLNADEQRFFGRVALPDSNGWFKATLPDCYIESLSQEHGIIVAPDEVMQHLKIGDVVMVIPVHVCLTANLLKSYVTVDGTHIDMMGF
ncbi:MAG TPA: alanine racemase [Aggregatilineales bacterium]|nr:alanine racemase [Aggregatilineales bacterium]